MVEPITIQITLAQSGQKNLVSRAQAKLIAREIEKHAGVRTVHLDFSDIWEMGQGFADQLLRVFASGHQYIDLQPINCNQSILAMIGRARRTIR